MFNLLPEKLRQKVNSEYKYRRLTLIFVFIIFIQISFFIFLFPTWATVSYKEGVVVSQANSEVSSVDTNTDSVTPVIK